MYPPALAFDGGKKVGSACKELSKLNMMSAGMAYLVNKEGIIVWREGAFKSVLLQTAYTCDHFFKSQVSTVRGLLNKAFLGSRSTASLVANLWSTSAQV
jgi:hypothetical protein